MIPIPFLKEILGGAAAILLIICIALGVALKTAKVQLNANAETITALNQQIENAKSTIVGIRQQLDDQNELIRAAEVLGAQSQARQEEIDRLARQLDNQKALISRIQRENIDLRERAKDLTVCETYELCLRSIAGVLP